VLLVAGRAALASPRGAADLKPVHLMLRHAYGFALANKGVDTRTIQDYLGHKTISTRSKYT